MIHFDILTIFPEAIEPYINSSIIKRAQEKDLLEVNVHNLRDWSKDKHSCVDDTPYGGGPGMVMKVEPVFEALKDLRKEDSKVLITTPKGEKLNQGKVEELSKDNSAHYIILCGHYEGFDQRIHDHLIDYEFSIGDYVLSGGELPALVLVDGITRLIPGVLGNEQSLTEESFNNDSLDFAQYTKPEIFNGWSVPEVLLSGHHENIKKWRKDQSQKDTSDKRPDIIPSS
jgi:tRNA (guanine37-N1)-methyltransferase